MTDLNIRYQQERGEYEACYGRGFPTYLEWLENQLDSQAERKRADSRFYSDNDQDDPYFEMSDHYGWES